MSHPTVRCALVGVLTVSILWSTPRAAAATDGRSAVSQERVLFPFDDYSIPFNKGVLLTLVPGRKSSTADPQHPNKPVLGVGKAGDPDERRVYFAGTIIK